VIGNRDEINSVTHIIRVPALAISKLIYNLIENQKVSANDLQ
jgi:hypothetical protein